MSAQLGQAVAAIVNAGYAVTISPANIAASNTTVPQSSIVPALQTWASTGYPAVLKELFSSPAGTTKTVSTPAGRKVQDFAQAVRSAIHARYMAKTFSTRTVGNTLYLTRL